MDSKKTILEARSKRNGIVFYSNKNPFICYEVYINEKGEIQKEQIPRGLSEIKDEDLSEAKYSEKMKVTEKRIKIAMAILGILDSENHHCLWSYVLCNDCLKRSDILH